MYYSRLPGFAAAWGAPEMPNPQPLYFWPAEYEPATHISTLLPSSDGYMA